jgi:septum site-determining protein MinC
LPNITHTQQTPVILDIQAPEFQANELAILLEILTQNNLVAIGIRTQKSELMAFAKFSGLAIFSLSNQHKAPENKSYKAPKIIKERVYAFDQIVAQNSDLVLLDKVNSGAELMASGSIMAYSSTGGHLFAGINGDKNATIFTQSFEAQLVSIAGIYKKINPLDVEFYQKPLRVELINHKLQFQII